MNQISKSQQIQQLLTRGVETIYPKPAFLETRLSEDKQITIYLGIDPTGPDLHIGHVIPLRKLREFQELGHKIILLIGDFTAMIGDPTDKKATRQQLTREQVLKNCASYKEQASKILRFDGDNPAEIRFNSEWLASMSFENVLNLSAHFTVQQMLERDMFENRIKEGKPVGLHEFLYPLMQGYDSVAMEIDGEVGGNDQTFNMLAGRTLEKQMLNKEKFVITMKLLADHTGKKMGKSEGNMITLNDKPNEMFGKVMSWTDGMIIGGFELCTELPMAEIEAMQGDLETDNINPRDLKMKLAYEIVALYHNENAAQQAKEYFVETFSKKQIPDELQEVTIPADATNIVDVLTNTGFCSSKSDARRNIEQGGVKINSEKVTDLDASVSDGDILQKGKRHFVKIKIG